ncbi:beta strand repeat-containing protein [Luteolibacter luteus]|uniref:PEP-CTERM sorting domain-containing protein n=1 Tax=Luteolibacter luteus TaxID=2728835 RepID=A0A858RQ90_9BACT|nr:autotransporter-associated beta strand repeat-containing protein [Luteolibacter luteus]QJE98694.1 hypothetical protein HHL09_23895 [Luteolibacter luteus]
MIPRQTLLALAAILPAAVSATDGNWTSTTSGGNWSDPNNWNAATPAGAGGIATLTSADLPAGNFGVVLDSAQDLGQLLLGDADPGSAGTWTISGASTLTLSGVATVQTNVNATISALVGGTSGLMKTGTASLTLSNGGNTYTGATTLKAGTLILGSNVNFGTGGIGTGTVTFDGGTLSHAYAGGNTLVYANAIDVAAGGGTLTASNRFRMNGAVTGAGTLNFGVSSNTERSDLQNNWSGFTGKLNLSGSGVVRLGVAALGSGQPNFNAVGWQNCEVNLAGSVIVRTQTNSGGNTVSIGALSGTSTTAKLTGGTAGAVTWSVGAKNTDTSFSGTIENNAAVQSRLTKVGTGSLTLDGASTYTGATIVSAGALYVNGSLGATAVSVDGGTFGGTGTVGGDVTVNAATFAAGASPGSIELAGNLNLTAASTAAIELAGTDFILNDTEGYDRIKLSGAAPTLTLGGGVLSISLTNAFALAANQVFGIVQLADGATRTGTFAGLLEDGALVGNFGGTDLFISYSGNIADTGTPTLTGGNDIVLYTVPEPRAAALGAIGLLMLLRRRRPL